MITQGHKRSSQGADFDIPLLSKILCYGLVLPDEVPTGYQSMHGIEDSFIQGSVFLLGGRRPINTSVWKSSAANELAVPLQYCDNELWIEGNSGPVLCSPLTQPAAIQERFLQYGKIGDYLKFHTASTVFAAPVRECVFGAIDRACQFCTYDMKTPKPLPPDVFVQMFLRLAKEQKIGSLAMGPGTPNLRDHGVRYIRKLITELQNHWNGTISVELVPPHDLRELATLIECNVGSLIMSIEIWDDSRRIELCPGKSYVSKDQYLEAWKAAVGLLGRGKVSSVLLVGLDKYESVINGIDAMVALGVVPTLIPFRPYPGIPLASHQPPDYRTYIELSKYNIKALSRAKIGPKMQVGCTDCGGCSLEIEKLS